MISHPLHARICPLCTTRRPACWKSVLVPLALGGDIAPRGSSWEPHSAKGPLVGAAFSRGGRPWRRYRARKSLLEAISAGPQVSRQNIGSKHDFGGVLGRITRPCAGYPARKSLLEAISCRETEGLVEYGLQERAGRSDLRVPGCLARTRASCVERRGPHVQEYGPYVRPGAPRVLEYHPPCTTWRLARARRWPRCAFNQLYSKWANVSVSRDMLRTVNDVACCHRDNDEIWQSRRREPR